MSRRKRSGLGCLALVSLAILCLFGGGAAAGVWLIPETMAKTIGPASPGLSPVQRVVTAAQLFVQRDDLMLPKDINGAEQSFSVQPGEPAYRVAGRLEEAGLINSGETMRLYLMYSGLDTSLQSGDYQLSPAMAVVEIAQALQDATPEEVEFNILTGWRAEEIAAALPTSGLEIQPDGFLQVVQSGRIAELPEGMGIGGNLEGFLLPGSYRIPRTARADEMVLLFVRSFDEQVTADLRAQFEKNGLTLGAAVTLASIVEREAVVEEEQPLIASVFFNRLAKGLPLESDPTVQYALGYNQARQTWWTNPLSSADLAVDSPYNTYQVGGLPPGPISNPGLAALRAVAYPAETPYYFFRAACDKSGKHSFAITYDEHVQNACP